MYFKFFWGLIYDRFDGELDLEMDDGGHGNLDRIGHVFVDLIMWRDVAKSSLWFGLGCLCFLSSCFNKGVNFRCAFLILSTVIPYFSLFAFRSIRYLNFPIP